MAITFNHNDQVYVKDGKMGIGASDPLRDLHVVGDFSVNASTSQYYGVLINGGESSNPAITIGDWHNSSATIKWDSTNNYLVIDSQHSSSGSSILFTGNDSATEYMRITGTGNVGIGTTNPASKLHISDGFIRVDASSNAQGVEIYGRSSDNIGELNFRTNSGVFLGRVDGRNDGLGIWSSSGLPINFKPGNTGTKVTFQNNGNVGIGTTAPGEKLDVVGTIRSTGNEGKIKINSTATNGKQYEFISIDTGNLGLYDGTAYRFWVGGNGNVGIGTTSPTAKLHVDIPGNTVAFRATRNGGADGDLELTFGSAIAGYNSKAGAHRWLESSSEKMRLTGGNLGIGTTSPFSKLEVLQSVSGTPLSLRSQGGNSGNVGIRFSIADNTVTTDAYNKAAIYLAGAGATNAIGDMVFAVNNTASSANVSLADERMRITRGGNVGIGGVPAVVTHGPHLDIVGNRGTLTVGTGYFEDNGTTNFLNGARPLSFGYAGSEKMRVHSNGNVGIGTTSPSAKLHVYAAYGTNELTTFSNATSGGRVQLGFQQNDSDGLHHRAYIRAFKDSNGNIGGRLDFYVREHATAAQAFVMTMRSNQNVGIGTTDPVSKLQVEGDIALAANGVIGQGSIYGNSGNSSFSTLKLYDSSTGNTVLNNQSYDIQLNTAGSTKMIVKNGGNVGIGTTSPDAHLHVSASSDAHLLIESDNTMSFYQDAAWSSTMMFGAKWNGTNQVYGATTRGAFKMVALHDADNSPQYLAIYGANHGTAGGTVTWNTVGFAQDENGNVGIGTTSPDHKLHVASSTTFGTVSRVLKLDQAASGGDTTQPTYYGSILLSGSGYNWGAIDTIQTNPSASWTSRMAFSTMPGGGDYNLYERMCITNGGNVGIGTTSPSAKLHAKSSGNGAYILRGMSSAGTDLGGLYQSTAGDGEIYLKTSAVTTNVRISSNNVSYLNGGNVGIGTTSPAQKLHVKGDIRADFNNTDGSAYLTGYGVEFERGTNYLRPRGTDGTQTLIFGGGSDSLDWNNIQFKTSDYINFRMSGADVFRITSAGNVGIGTTSPGRQLELRGQGVIRLNAISGGDPGLDFNTSDVNDMQIRYRSTTDALAIYSYETSSDVLTIKKSDGNVGIGTANMYARLNVKATSHNNGISVNRQADTTAAIYIGNDGGNNPVLAANNADMIFGRDVSGAFTERMRLTNGGNLGIGTTSPAAPLDVQPASDYKVTKVGDDRTSHYKFTGATNHTLTLSSGSYHSSEVVITAHQTNGGTNNNIYIRGIWTNNHTSHHWHEIEHIGSLAGSAFTITNGQSGGTANSGELEIVHNYTSGSFGQMVVRVTDHYGTHSYTIS